MVYGKKIYVFFFLIGFVLGNAQTGFPYNQQWGSYVGGAGTFLLDYGFDGNSFFTDSQKNIYLNGHTVFVSGYTASYYNQFITAGGNAAVLPIRNRYHTTFSASGQMLFGTYTGIENGLNSQLNDLIGIDHQDNKYYFKQELGLVSNLATPGVWLTQYTSSASNFTYTLSKYNAAGNLVWKTYLPNDNWYQISLRFDEANNIYLRGLLDEELSGLSTPGVFQENYIHYANPSGSDRNSFMVKLNTNGQKLWATYSVAGILNFAYYNGSIFTINSYHPTMPGPHTTPGTFQPLVPALQLLMKFDANTGQRVWSTFYGTPITYNFSGLGNYGLAVNETGIYVSGQSEDTDYPTYFATTGAFQSQLAGGGDLYLSKFDQTGNRIWSTYFGSAGYDEILGSPNMTLLGNRIVITGNQHGNASNISTPGAFSTTPANTSSSSSMFFAEFDTSGNRKWCSYFAGPGNNPFGEQLNPEFLSDGTLVLWGGTGAQTGIGTENGHFPTMTNPYPGQPFGFVTRFIFRDSMGTSETEIGNDLVLYDNPNNGNFTISGSALQNQQCGMIIFDAAGRVIYTEKMKKIKTQEFKKTNFLPAGNYFVQVNGNRGEKLKVFKMTVKK